MLKAPETPPQLTPRQEKELALFKEGTPESHLVLADLLQESDNALDKIMGETMALAMKQTGEQTEEMQQMLDNRHNQILQQYNQIDTYQGHYGIYGAVINVLPEEGLVKSIEIRNTTVEHIITILSHPASRFVTYLDLSENYMGDEGLRVLADSANMRNITSLKLFKNSVGEKGAKALADSVNMRNLTSLDLAANNVEAKGVKTLADSVNMRNLTSLDLSWNNVGDEGVRSLADSINMRNLTSLCLVGNNVGDEGVRSLADSANMRNLTLLFLEGNKVGDEGARVLADSPYLKNTNIYY